MHHDPHIGPFESFSFLGTLYPKVDFSRQIKFLFCNCSKDFTSIPKMVYIHYASFQQSANGKNYSFIVQLPYNHISHDHNFTPSSPTYVISSC